MATRKEWKRKRRIHLGLLDLLESPSESKGSICVCNQVGGTVLSNLLQYKIKKFNSKALEHWKYSKHWNTEIIWNHKNPTRVKTKVMGYCSWLNRKGRSEQSGPTSQNNWLLIEKDRTMTVFLPRFYLSLSQSKSRLRGDNDIDNPSN
jgi:hypothetical protein